LLLLFFFFGSTTADLTWQASGTPKSSSLLDGGTTSFTTSTEWGYTLTGPAMEQPILPHEQFLWTFMPNWYKCYKHVYHFLLPLPQLILQSIYVSTLTQIGFFSNLHTSLHILCIYQKKIIILAHLIYKVSIPTQH